MKALTSAPYGTPHGDLYDPAMAKVEQVSVEEARKSLGRRVERAGTESLHTALTKHGKTGAVIVPLDWYRRMREKDGDPTDL